MNHPHPLKTILLCCLTLTGSLGAWSPCLEAQEPADPLPAAQDKEASPPAEDQKDAANTTIVIGRRTEDELVDVPSTVEALSEDYLVRRRAYRTLPEALAEVPGVLVQKTSRGQGSPYIRGFTGFRTLLLVDGIRLNHAAMRSGPNQYWGTVDPLALDRIEIFKGPASVLYGSDAIGGTVNAISRSPVVLDSPDYRGADGYRLYLRHSTAERSFTSRYEYNRALTRNSAALLGVTSRDFGNLQTGGDTGSLPETGYDELDGDAKVVFYPTEDLEVVLALQSVKMNDAPRTHSTIHSRSYRGTTIGSDLKRDFDQRRRLAYIQANWEPTSPGLLDRVTLSLSNHQHDETEKRISSNGRLRRQGFHDDVFGSFIQGESESSLGLLTLGVEYYRDSIDSFFSEFEVDGSLRVERPRGPIADDATYDLLGIYAQDVFSLSDRLELTAGGRLNYASADAAVVDPDPTDTNAIDPVSEDFSAAVGSLRATYRLEDGWSLYGGVSEGFRAPNLSDLTRFDVSRSGELEVPAPRLEPEEYTSLELGARWFRDDLEAYAAVHHNFIEGLIVRSPTGDVIDGLPVVTKENSADGFVRGIELGGSWLVAQRWSLFGALAWLDGETDNPTTGNPEPLSRLMPLTGLLGIRWVSEDDTWWVEGTLTMVKGQDKLSARDAGDTQRIPPGGTPGFSVISIRGGKELFEDCDLFLGLENIADKDYRNHGSGQNEPGLNAIMGLDWKF
ncbi:MAG: TonB-dependent receptor [Planctomycetota bacterium]|nr:TonB-dependent receptor [Planctomycetota bacterium]